MSIKDKLFIGFQYLVPQHLLSRAAGWLADTHISWIKNPFTRWFVSHFQVDMSEALNSDPCSYNSFNEFFTRALKPGARPISVETNAIVSPADGTISQIGSIQGHRIIQAKGHDYSLHELLADDEHLASNFEGGSFAVIYLSPRDYHRVHMPLTGTLQSMSHVPGDLFSVNDCTAANVPRLFARNERLVNLFESNAGQMAVILVGAMIVASIETVWAGQVTPVPRTVRTTLYTRTQHLEYATGDEMGRFKLGSTVVLLFEKGRVEWLQDLRAGSALRMGQIIGRYQSDDR